MTAPTIRPLRALLWQPRNWTYWLYLAAVLLAFVGVVQLFQPFGLITTVAATSAVLAFVALSAVVALIVVWLTVIHRPPTVLLVAAVLWGGLVAVAIGVEVNDSLLSVLPHVMGIGTANAWGAAIAGPTDEEWLKAAGVLAVLAIGGRSVTRPIQGLFVGAWCGLGFQVVEDLTYAMSGALGNTGSDLAGVVQAVGVRGTLGLLPSHWVFTACSGLGIGYALVRRDRPLPVRILFAVAMFAVGWSMHFLWNSPLLTGQLNPNVGSVLKLVIILAAFFVVYRLAMRAEWRWYRHVVATDPALAGTAGHGAVAPGAVPPPAGEPGTVPPASSEPGAVQPGSVPVGSVQPGSVPVGATEGAAVTDDEIDTLRTRRRRYRARRRIRRTVRRQARPEVGGRRAAALGKRASRLVRRLHRAQGWLAITAASEPDQLPALQARIAAVRTDLAELGIAPEDGTGRRRRHRRADRQRDRHDVNRPREHRGAGHRDADDRRRGRADAGRADAGRADAGRADDGRADDGRADDGRADDGRADAGQAARPDGTDRSGG